MECGRVSAADILFPLSARIRMEPCGSQPRKDLYTRQTPLRMLGWIAPVAKIMGWTPTIDPELRGALCRQTSRETCSASKQDTADLLLFLSMPSFLRTHHIWNFDNWLTGYDSSWTNDSSALWHDTRHLSPGNLHFEVQARRSGEDWSNILWPRSWSNKLRFCIRPGISMCCSVSNSDSCSSMQIFRRRGITVR